MTETKNNLCYSKVWFPNFAGRLPLDGKNQLSALPTALFEHPANLRFSFSAGRLPLEGETQLSVSPTSFFQHHEKKL